jgi:hypothetical protein
VITLDKSVDLAIRRERLHDFIFSAEEMQTNSETSAHGILFQHSISDLEKDADLYLAIAIGFCLYLGSICPYNNGPPPGFNQESYLDWHYLHAMGWDNFEKNLDRYEAPASPGELSNPQQDVRLATSYPTRSGAHLHKAI